MTTRAEQVAAELCTEEDLAYAQDSPTMAVRQTAIDAYRRGLVDMARHLRPASPDPGEVEAVARAVRAVFLERSENVAGSRGDNFRWDGWVYPDEIARAAIRALDGYRAGQKE